MFSKLAVLQVIEVSAASSQTFNINISKLGYLKVVMYTRW